MRTLHIIMPMAGEGSRFIKEGWNTPKPLIKLKGKEIFLHALDSIKAIDAPKKYSFIVRKNHVEENKVDELIKKALPNAEIFIVDTTTRGAVETCLKAKSSIDKNEAILIMDCDLEFYSKAFNDFIESQLLIKGEKFDGGVVSFRSDKPNYSYAKTLKGNIVEYTAEKEVISNHALCGAYFFSSGSGFIEVSEEMISDTTFSKPEFYVSLLYNRLIDKGGTIKLSELDLYKSYGTPLELSENLYD